MSRTPQQIRDSLSATIQSVDPSTDLDKGPISDFLLDPVPPELAQTELQVEQLGQLVSLQLSAVATTDQLNSIGTSFGISKLSGRNSQCRQTFFTFTQPTVDIVIPRGALVGVSDNSLIYVVDEQVTLPALQQSVFFNASRRRWEITARVVAVASGPDFDLPAFRIIKILSRLGGIDGTENREPATGGLTQQANADYFRRIQLKFAGQNPEAGAGIISSVIEYDPDDVADVALVYPKDREIFKRDISRPAIDVYVSGTDPKSTTFTTTPALGGETVFNLPNVPVLSVDSVLKNNVAITGFAFVPDTTPQTQQSARAVDQVVLTTPLVAGQVLTIGYTFNNLISGLQANRFSSKPRQFDTDLLARSALEVAVAVDLSITVLPSFDTARVSDAVKFLIFQYVNPSVFVSDLLPEVLRQNILQQVSGISSVTVNTFTSTGNSPVGVVKLLKNQIPVVDQANLVIRVRQ